MNRLLQLLDGQKVAIIGNGNVTKDVSKKVDSADVVIRFNNFYNYDSDKVGKRVDIVMQTITQSWLNDANKHLDVIKEQKPNIFIVKRPDLYDTSVHGIYGSDIRIDDMANEFEPWRKHTTGTCVLAYLAKELKNAEVRCYGFQDNDDWERYINTDARHYYHIKEQERALMLDSIKTLESLKISEPHVDIPRAIVIPIKEKSEGFDGKNRMLIRPCLNEALKCDIDVYVVGDDIELLKELEGEYKGKITTYVVPPIYKYADVTETIRTWRDMACFCGEIALVTCTSPFFKHEWVHLCFNELSKAPISATACELGFKPTAIYKREDGVFVPYAKDMPSASVARQLLPQTIRVNGAVVAFHTDCLEHPSLYMGGVLAPVVVSEEESVDIDTKKDLKKAKKVNKKK